MAAAELPLGRSGGRYRPLRLGSLGWLGAVAQGFDAAGHAFAVVEGAFGDALEIALNVVMGLGGPGAGRLVLIPVGAWVQRSLGQESGVAWRRTHGPNVAMDTVRLCTQFRRVH